MLGTEFRRSRGAQSLFDARLPVRPHGRLALRQVGELMLGAVRQPHDVELPDAAPLRSVSQVPAVGRGRRVIVQRAVGRLGQAFAPAVERDAEQLDARRRPWRCRRPTCRRRTRRGCRCCRSGSRGRRGTRPRRDSRPGRRACGGRCRRHRPHRGGSCSARRRRRAGAGRRATTGAKLKGWPVAIWRAFEPSASATYTW